MFDEKGRAREERKLLFKAEKNIIGMDLIDLNFFEIFFFFFPFGQKLNDLTTFGVSFGFTAVFTWNEAVVKSTNAFVNTFGFGDLLSNV